MSTERHDREMKDTQEEIAGGPLAHAGGAA